MTSDKLYNVEIFYGGQYVLGIVKAATMEAALEYLRREYEGGVVKSIEESPRKFL